MTTTIPAREVKPNECARYRGALVGGEGVTLVTTNGHWTVSVSCRVTGWHKREYTVGDDVCKVYVGPSRSDALRAMRSRWAEMGVVVRGTDACYAGRLIC